jgi:hypothetical protein
MDQDDIDIFRDDFQGGVHRSLTGIPSRHNVKQLCNPDAAEFNSQGFNRVGRRCHDNVIHLGMTLENQQRLKQDRLASQHTELLAMPSQPGPLTCGWNNDGNLSPG